MQKVIIIGAGIGGLAAANLLAKNGYNVTVFEKNSTAGGRAMVWEKDGFTFDMGPSWFMTPQFFENYFSILGKKTSDYFELVKLDPAYQIEYEGEKIDFSTDESALNNTLSSLSAIAPKQFKKLLHSAEEKYDLTVENLLYKTSSSWFELLNPKLLWTLLKGGILHTYHTEVAKYIQDKRIQAAVEFFTIFLGGSQHNMPAIYVQILHMVFNQHIWYPIGGFGKVVDAFTSIAKELKVLFKFNSSVDHILVENGKAIGVVSKGKEYFADVVIANAEIPHAEQLLDPEYRQYKEKYWRKRVLSPATLLIFLGLKSRLKKVHHHTVIFRNMDVHLDSVYDKQGWWPEKPSYYISAPSVTDRSIVPKGSEAIMLLVPLSPQLVPDEKKNEEIAAEVLADFERYCGENVRDSIVVKRVVAHQHFIDTFNSYKGASFGLANTFFQTAWLRPRNKSSKVEHLYFCGHYTVPGVGFPTSLISGQLVAEEVLGLS